MKRKPNREEIEYLAYLQYCICVGDLKFELISARYIRLFSKMNEFCVQTHLHIFRKLL